MRNLLSSRILVFAIVIAVCAVLLSQNMGLAGAQGATETGNTDSTMTASTTPQMDWALAGLLLGGALITLLRPRRRKVVAVTSK